MGVSLHGFILETGFQTEMKKAIAKWVQRKLTRYWHYSDKLYKIKDNSMLQRDSMRGTKLHLK